MRLHEAIASGQPFRRASGWGGVWATLGTEYPYSLLDAEDGKLFGHLHAEDILADDYEIQEPTVTITWSEFGRAMDAVLPDIPGNELNQVGRDNIRRLALELGLLPVKKVSVARTTDT